MNPLSLHSLKVYLISPELDDPALPLFVSVTGVMALAIFKRWYRESAHSTKADASCINHVDKKQDPSSQDEALTFLAVSIIDKEPKELPLYNTEAMGRLVMVSQLFCRQLWRSSTS